MNAVIEQVRSESDAIYRQLDEQYQRLLRTSDASVATTALIDACSDALADALAPMPADARRAVMQMVCDTTLESAERRSQFEMGRTQ